MNRSNGTLLCLLCCGSSALAQSDPPSLVGIPTPPTTTSASVDFATPLLWLAVALGAAMVALIVWRWLISRPSKSVRSSAVFVTMCRGLKLTSADQRLLKQLARDESGVTPITMILCPSVFERAAARAGAAVNKDALHRLRQRLAG